MSSRVQWRAAALGLALAALAAGTASAEKARRGEAAPAREVVSGAQIAIDPATGKLRAPSPEEARELGREFGVLRARATGPVRLIKHANGGLTAEVPEQFENYSVATIGADGKLVFGCVDHGAIESWLAAPPANPTLEEK